MSEKTNLPGVSKSQTQSGSKDNKKSTQKQSTSTGNVGNKKTATNSALSMNQTSKVLQRKRNKKAKREEGAPKLPQNGYVRYMSCRRDEVRLLFPGKNAIELTKIIAEEWNRLSDELKKPYLRAAEADKERYLRQLFEYNKMKKTEKQSSPECRVLKMVVDPSDNIGPLNNEVSNCANNGGNNYDIKPSISQISVLPIKKPPQQQNQQPHPQQQNRTGDNGIQIFTEEFLEHNKTADAELRMLRKSNIDYEQQNAVLEKHIDNIKVALCKMEAENNAIIEKNRLLAIYLDKLKLKLVLALSGLPLPGQPNGATLDNIDNYMAELHSMATSNSHGPAALNKAKDIIRKLDLHIEL